MIALGDKGYHGYDQTRQRVITPYKGKNKPESHKDANRRPTLRLRRLGEWANAQLKYWRVLHKVRVSPRHVAGLAKAWPGRSGGVKVAGPLLLYVTWLAGVHWLAAAASIWNGLLLGESIFWTIVAGFAPLFRMANPRKHRLPFRSLLRDLVTITVFFGFFFNLKPLNLAGELILQRALTILLRFQVVAEHKTRSQQVSKLCKFLLALAALGMAVYTVVWLV